MSNGVSLWDSGEWSPQPWLRVLHFWLRVLPFTLRDRFERNPAACFVVYDFGQMKKKEKNHILFIIIRFKKEKEEEYQTKFWKCRMKGNIFYQLMKSFYEPNINTLNCKKMPRKSRDRESFIRNIFLLLNSTDWAKNEETFFSFLAGGNKTNLQGGIKYLESFLDLLNG